jgi:predicted metal-dependent phosphoesterase TrpH
VSVDLHLHSSASDGSAAPNELASSLGAATAVALTDHDTIDGVADFREALPEAVRFIVGAELSLATDSGTFHLLCYGAGLLGSKGAALLGTLADDRARRNDRMLERAQDLGIDLAAEDLLAAAGVDRLDAKSVGRPHAAAALVTKGYASSIQDAFDRYLAKGRPLYVPKARHGFADVQPTLGAIGVATVVAHPLSLELPPDELEARLAELRDEGLVGVEAYYAAYTPDTRRELARLAERLSLIATGGSDAHGTFKPGLAPITGYGDLEVPDEAADALIEAIEHLGGSRDLY